MVKLGRKIVEAKGLVKPLSLLNSGEILTLLQGLTSQMVSLSSAWKCLGSESLGNGFTKSSAAIFFYDVSTNFQGLPLPELYWIS